MTADERWTLESLKEYLDGRINALERRFDEAIEQVRRETAQALANADKATLKAETASEKRLEGVNEFRGQLADQVKTFITRETYDAFHAALSDKVSVLENRVTAIASEKVGGRERTSAIYAFAGFLVSLMVLGGLLAASGAFSR